MKMQTVKELFGQCSCCHGRGKTVNHLKDLYDQSGKPPSKEQTCRHCGGSGMILLQKEITTTEESEVE